jgi:hypothetical protein
MSDLGFLPQTLTFHESLTAKAREFHLTVLCMDDVCLSFLRDRRLAGVDLVSLAELERAVPALAATRERETWRVYCWTAIPVFVDLMLNRVASGTVVFWIDSDVEFFHDPALLLDELGDGSILLTPHRYNRAYPISAPASELAFRYGQFNGGTIAFRRDADGLAAAELWRDLALGPGGFDRFDPSRHGNQVHIDDFAQRFAGAQVLKVPGGVLGPWNGGRFRVGSGPDGPTADGQRVFAYHYQSLRLGHASPPLARALLPNLFELSAPQPPLQARAQPHYRLSLSEQRVFWRPYLRRLGPALVDVLQSEPRFLAALAPPPSRPGVFDASLRHLRLELSRVVVPPIRRYVHPVRDRLLVSAGIGPRHTGDG